MFLPLRQWVKVSWLDGVTDSVDMSLSKLRESVLAKTPREALCSAAHGVAKSRPGLSDCTELNRVSWWLSGQESACQCGRCGFDPRSGKLPHGCRATKRVNHSASACVLDLGSCNHSARLSRLLKPGPPRAHTPRLEKPPPWAVLPAWLEKTLTAVKAQHSQTQTDF